ncbi:MAG: hypothetical protein IJK26_09670 [Clostridia bacterium]|nr:hypothetical protein [Clostridia bacterium]
MSNVIYNREDLNSLNSVRRSLLERLEATAKKQLEAEKNSGDAFLQRAGFVPNTFDGGYREIHGFFCKDSLGRKGVLELHQSNMENSYHDIFFTRYKKGILLLNHCGSIIKDKTLLFTDILDIAVKEFTPITELDDTEKQILI